MTIKYKTTITTSQASSPGGLYSASAILSYFARLFVWVYGVDESLEEIRYRVTTRYCPADDLRAIRTISDWLFFELKQNPIPGDPGAEIVGEKEAYKTGEIVAKSVL